MIKNQKQAALTKEKLKMLIKEREDFQATANKNNTAELLLAINSFNALISDLTNELSEFEQLTQGNLHIIAGKALNDTAKLLIGGRIAQGISQRELAERLGLQEQQIQRYEITDYESASLSRVIDIADALEIKCFFEKIIIVCDEPSFDLPDNLTKEGVQRVQEQIKSRRALFCIE